MASSAILGPDKGRLESLSDGVFATVMTVLVLSLSIPTIIGASNAVVTSYVVGLGPTILSYVMSFLILAVFWARHNSIFRFIARVDNGVIWLNMLFLLTVGFVPFSTELLGRFWNTEIATIIYGSNLIASGICMQGVWSYALWKKMLVVDQLDERLVERVNRRLLGGPGLYFLAILTSLILKHGTEIAVVIYVVALIYYVLGASLRSIFPRSGDAESEPGGE